MLVEGRMNNDKGKGKREKKKKRNRRHKVHQMNMKSRKGGKLSSKKISRLSWL